MQQAEPRAPELEIRLLGPVEARLSERPLALDRLQQRALLALLALNANRVVSTDQLIDALWGERPPATASVALYGLVSGLRKLLEPDHAGTVVTKSPGYLLQLSPEQIDLGHFELLAAEGRRALDLDDAETASALLTEALELWRGPPLQDLQFLPFAQKVVGRLEELRLAVIEARVEADLAAGRDGDLVPELESLVSEHPLRERLRGQLMLALYRVGRQADALAAYRDARTVLADELGLEPSHELQELERSILRHDPSLAARVSAPGDAAAARTGDGSAPLGLPERRSWIAIGTVLVAVGAVTVLAITRSGKNATLRIPADGVGVLEHGKVVAAGSLGASPSDIAAGGGALWVTSADEQTVSRVDPDTGEVRQTIPVGSGPSGVAADDHGVWVANSLDGTVSRIDPRTNTVVETIPVEGSPVAVAVGPRSVWIASRDGQSISRLDSRTGDPGVAVPVGPAPRALAVGANSLWVADEKRGVVFRIDPGQRRIVDTITVGNGPVDIAVGERSVWVANNLDGTVSRIDPVRGAVTAVITTGDGPRGIAVTPDGVWVSNEFDGTLALIDPGSNTRKRVVRIGERPEGLAARGGRLFLAVRSAGATHRGGTLRLAGVNGPFQPGSVDTTNYSIAPTTILTNDGLVGFRRVGGADGSQLVPDLAVALATPTDDGRTYTFRLRAGISYSTGRPVQPADFRQALERALIITHDPSHYYGAIVGADTCIARPKRCNLSRGIATDGRAQTVTFHLREPDPDFLYKLALPYAFAVPADTPAKDVGTHPLPATGPYLISSYKPRTRGGLTLLRNPRFHEWSKAAQPAGYPDRIIFARLRGSTRSVVRAVERGRQDLALNGVPPDLEDEVATQYASQKHVNPLTGTTYLFLNTKVPPFDDIRARHALNYAADRAAGVRISSRASGAQPTCQILPPNFPGYQPYCPYTLRPRMRREWTSPDLERANQLVAASASRGAVVTVWVPDNHRGEAAFAATLLRSLGYRARTKRVSDKVYYNPAKGPLNPRRHAQAGLFSWFADYPAASNYFGTFFSCRAPSNWSEFCDRGIEAEIQRALKLQSGDPYLANRLWARIDREIVDKAPVVPLFTLKQVDIVSRRVGNYQFHPQWGVLLGQLWVR
jgi:peptide/nickel transport system substrate-binding protein